MASALRFPATLQKNPQNLGKVLGKKYCKPCQQVVTFLKALSEHAFLSISFSNAIGGNIVQISRNSLTLLVGAAASALILSACGGGGSSTTMTEAKAQAQAALTVAASFSNLSTGEKTNLNITGGSGNGAVTYQATGGCTVSGSVLTARSTAGSCSVTAAKAADGTSYLAATSTNTLTITVISDALVSFSETRAADSLLIPFEGLSTSSTITTDPADASNKVAKLIKVASGQLWAGATVSTCDYPSNGTSLIPFSNTVTRLSMRVKGPASVRYRLKVEGEAGTTPMEQDVTSSAIADTWQELTFDFATPAAGTFDATKKWSKVSVFPAYMSAVTADTTYYIDNIKVVGVSDLSVTCQTEPVEPAPSAAATLPDTTAHPQSNVIAIYSDSYDQRPGLDFPTWGSPTIVSGKPFGVNNTLKLGGLTYNGVTWTTEVNVSTFTNLHVDLWSAEATSVDVFLISKDSVEEKVTVTLTANAWTSVDKLMSGFTAVDKTQIYQAKLVATPSGKTVYMDNLYFWK